MTEFVIATDNPDKRREIQEILGPGVSLLGRPADLGEIDETGETLEENARIKAAAVAAHAGRPAVADDTGLEVDHLGGAPGVYSARFSGPDATYATNVAKLLHEMEGECPSRRARFRTVAMVVWPDGRELACEGVVDGSIASEARGSDGFGYDPVFIPDEGDGRTFAEMSAAEKHALSHRGRAFRALADRLASSGHLTGHDS